MKVYPTGMSKLEIVGDCLVGWMEGKEIEKVSKYSEKVERRKHGGSGGEGVEYPDKEVAAADETPGSGSSTAVQVEPRSPVTVVAVENGFDASVGNAPHIEETSETGYWHCRYDHYRYGKESNPTLLHRNCIVAAETKQDAYTYFRKLGIRILSCDPIVSSKTVELDIMAAKQRDDEKKAEERKKREIELCYKEAQG